jgi:hypothetical protein
LVCCGGADRINLTNCFIQGVGSGASVNCFTPRTYFSMEGCIIQGIDINASSSIIIPPTTEMRIVDNYISMDNTTKFSEGDMPIKTIIANNVFKLAQDISWSSGVFLLSDTAGIVNGNMFEGYSSAKPIDSVIEHRNYFSAVITNNYFNSVNYGFVFTNTAGALNISGNTFDNSLNPIYCTTKSKLGKAIIADNTYEDCTGSTNTANLVSERRVSTMRNGTGGDSVAGSIVVIKNTATGGNEFTTTTTQGDSLVCGMCLESNASEYNCAILTNGVTDSLKVNGTDNIAVGDYICASTVAGIGVKAGYGDTAIAIALEAYTTDDSSGVIDALIIEPKYITNDTVWEDMRVTPAGFDRAGIADPSLVSYQPGGSGTATYLYEFQKNDIAYFTVQIPHAYKLGTDIYAHVHWTAGANGATENGHTVGWKIDYSWANVNSNFGAMAELDLSDACDGTDHKHQMTPDVVIDGHTSAKGISSMLICNIKRTDTGTDDTWVGTASGELPMILEIDFHYEIDTLGSRQISTK